MLVLDHDEDISEEQAKADVLSLVLWLREPANDVCQEVLIDATTWDAAIIDLEERDAGD